MHLGCHIGGKDPIRIVLSHNEISRGQSRSQVEKTRYGLTFIDRLFCLLWYINGEYRGPKPLSERTHTNRVFHALPCDPVGKTRHGMTFFDRNYFPFG
jgi:hypothetical protein